MYQATLRRISLKVALSRIPPFQRILVYQTQKKTLANTKCYLSTSASVSCSNHESSPEANSSSNKFMKSNNINNLLSKKASIRRTFSPNSNAQAMLVCGGKELAAYASFDPEYKRAKDYIQNHAVGPAVLSPILISGLIGALIESTLPQSFFISGTMNQLRPLIVGVEVEANIQVVSVKSSSEELSNNEELGGFNYKNMLKHGYELNLDTEVKRVSDGAVISTGNQTIWLPDYGSY